ncbi:MAG: AraC family transcriptional regulator [Chitinophagaceae bacterium]|nr:AraC family transcriptional regulator [Chitinophagaceae bacterium]
MTEEVLVYINNHLDSKITLESLAEVTGYSPFHLHRKLSADLGMSLGKYIQQQRLHTAAYFLALTRIPLDDIKYLVGFADNSSFGRAFKKQYQVSPMQYRVSQKHQQNFPPQTFSYVASKGPQSRNVAKMARLFPSHGDYFSKKVYAVWKDVANFIDSIGRAPADFEYYSILHECPHLSGNKQCRYDAAIVPKGFELPSEPFLQAKIMEGHYIQFDFCSKVKEYGRVSGEINNWLSRQSTVRHRNGVSYFKFDTLPNPNSPDNLFIHWYLPIE